MKDLIHIFTLVSLIFNPISGQGDFNIDLLYNWNDTSLPKNVYNASYNEIWGMALKGKEYAIIGSTAGTHIFDVTVPSDLKLARFVQGISQGSGVRHRDFHDYKGYLYIVGDEAPNALQIVDLNALPDSAPMVYNSNSLFTTAHNIYIDTATGKLYTAGNDRHPGIVAFTLTDPTNPVMYSSIRLPELTHDLYVRNDTAYVNDGNAGLYVVDFNVRPPEIIGSLTNYPDKGYNHAGWLSDDGKTYVFTDETHGTDVKICDVSDLSNIKVLSRVNSGVDQNSIAHNVIIKGNYAFLSYFHDGFYIFNIADPSNPVLTGVYDTYLTPGHSSWMGAWGIYPHLPSGNTILSDKHFGLFVFDVSKATPVKEPVANFSSQFFVRATDKNIFIEVPHKKKGLTLEILDTQGKIKSWTEIEYGKSISLNREKLVKGVYYLKAYSLDYDYPIQKLFLE